MSKENRADIFNGVIERLDHLAEMGVVGPGGDILITAEEAGAIMCLDKDTLLIYGQMGKIPRYKINGAVRFGLREICDWAASCRQPSLAEKKAGNRQKASA
jgi:hypothetical protein